MVVLSGCSLDSIKEVDSFSDLFSKSYTVTFNANGGELISGSLEQTVKKGESAIAPAVKNGTKTLSWDNDFSNITEDTVVNAVWTPVYHTVTFYPDIDGLSPVKQKVEEGEAAIVPEFTADMMVFTGWDKDFSDVRSDIKVTALWERKVLSGQEISDYSDSRVATVYVYDGANKASWAGSGFFIDSNGTFVINYHVIEYAESITIEMSDGATYNVSKIIKFSDMYDLAVHHFYRIF